MRGECPSCSAIVEPVDVHVGECEGCGSATPWGDWRQAIEKVIDPDDFPRVVPDGQVVLIREPTPERISWCPACETPNFYERVAEMDWFQCPQCEEVSDPDGWQEVGDDEPEAVGVGAEAAKPWWEE